MDKKRPKTKAFTNNANQVQINIKNNKHPIKKDSEKIIYLPKQISLKQKQQLPQQQQHPYEKPKPSETPNFNTTSKQIKSERNNILSKVIFLDKNKQHIEMNSNSNIKNKLLEKNNPINLNTNDNRKQTENEIYNNYTSHKNNNSNNKDANSFSLNKNMIYKRKKSKDHCVHKSEKRKYLCNTPVVYEKIKTKIDFDNIEGEINKKMTIQENEKDNYIIKGFSQEEVYKPKTKSFVVPNTNNFNFMMDTPDINNNNHNLFVDEKETVTNDDLQLPVSNNTVYMKNNNNNKNFIIVNHDQMNMNVKSYSESKAKSQMNNEQSSTLYNNSNNKIHSHKKPKRDYDFLAPVVKISLDLDKDIPNKQPIIQQGNNNNNNNTINTKKKQSTLESPNVITKGVPDLSLLSTNRTDNNYINITNENHKQPNNNQQQLNINNNNKEKIQKASSLTITPHHTSHKFFPHKSQVIHSSNIQSINDSSISNREFISFLRNSVHHKSTLPESSYSQLPQQNQEQITRSSFKNNIKNTSSFINENLNTLNNYRHRVLNDFDNSNNNTCTLSPSHGLFVNNDQRNHNESSDNSSYYYYPNSVYPQAKKHESDSNLKKVINSDLHNIDARIRSHFGSFSDKSCLNGLRHNFDLFEDHNERGCVSNKKYNLIYDYEKIGKELLDDQAKNYNYSSSNNHRNNANKKRIIGSNSFVNQQQVKEIRQFELFN